MGEARALAPSAEVPMCPFQGKPDAQLPRATEIADPALDGQLDQARPARLVFDAQRAYVHPVPKD